MSIKHVVRKRRKKIPTELASLNPKNIAKNDARNEARKRRLKNIAIKHSKKMSLETACVNEIVLSY